ncbi:FtsX-like permease family protein [Xanthobacter dioxanivorans]|uniref:FtsX-like permease family protein n=1 Tax=Xanthobacter dioxanivorans TaxID=2528964 RepID=A0A974PRK5_9HYPH|nr:FtsX-like permease family protein [Xanthobacter dioxanivorans]QRG08236.1 FtsX-like permease family protein [Xanthobacter dioxanivorans]
MAQAPATPRLPLGLRFALRELRGARRGFGIFLGCLVLGVMAIAGIGSFAGALSRGLEREGRAILGGDAAFTVVQRQATAEERALLDAGGTVGTVALLRAMARTEAGEAALAEVKAVDGAYPLVGAMGLDPPQPLPAVLSEANGVFGAAADPVLLGRLGLKVGDRLLLGDAALEIRATLASEPDKLATGVGLGARLLVPQAALAATGLIQPGSLVRWSYRVRLADPSPAALVAFMDKARPVLGTAGFEMRTRDGATPQLARNVTRISQFLTLVALTALLVGGVGVANAVTGHLSAKREVIATLKALGATRRDIFLIYGTQIGLIALVGIGIGLALGAMLPFAAAAAIGALVPYPLDPTLDVPALAAAAVYGLLVAALFAVLPLARAQETRVSDLFREAIAVSGARLRPAALVLAGGFGLVLAGLALATSDDKRAAAIFIVAAAAVFVLLRGVGLGLMALARRAPRPRDAMARLALGNLYRPGALTASVVLSLGLGLSLMVGIALIDASLSRELTGPMRETAPSFFFVDVPSAEEDAFRAFLAEAAPGAVVKSVPMLRGRITALNGVPAEEVKPRADAAWVLQSDRGISSAAEVPEGSRLVQGAWWAPDAREPLVSFDAELAAGLGLKLGDTVTVSVLGRSLTARIANLREVKWERLGINFVMVFTPAAFAGAPYTVLSTLTFPDGGDTAREVALLKAAAARFPGITTVRVKETLEEARRMLDNLSLGIRAASLVTLVTSVLVLAGALAAGREGRIYDAVILKMLGATRGRIAFAYVLEYGALGLATALFSVVAGSLAAYGVVTLVMEIPFTFSSVAAAGAVAGALVVTIGFGLLGTLRALGTPPARILRHL